MSQLRGVPVLYDKKPYSLMKRGNVWYCRFLNPDDTWSTAKSTKIPCYNSKGKEINQDGAIAWAIEMIKQDKQFSKNIALGDYAEGFFLVGGKWWNHRSNFNKRVSIRQSKEKCALTKNYIVPSLGKKKIYNITEYDIEKFTGELVAKGFSSSTINKTLICLDTLLLFAKKEKIINYRIISEKRGSDSKARGVLKPTEVQKIFKVEWSDFRAYVANLLACTTGLRQSEILALQHKDYQDDFIEVYKAWDTALSTLNNRTKSGKVRFVTIPSKVSELIKELISVSPFQDPEAFIFYSTVFHKPMESGILRSELYKAMELIGLESEERKERRVDFHSWRHWMNSYLINSKIPAYKVQSIIGHASNEMTENYYHADEMEDVRKIQNTLADQLMSDTIAGKAELIS